MHSPCAQYTAPLVRAPHRLLDAAASREYNRHTEPVRGQSRGETGNIIMNFRTVARALALTVFAGSTILAHAPAAPAGSQLSSGAPDLPLLPYETMTLPNGLK